MTTSDAPMRFDLDAGAAHLWPLRTDVTHLNHGSYGAAPRAVLRAQQALRDELEAQPMAFFEALPARLDRARERVAALVGAEPAALAFVPNATTAVNAVLRSLPLEAGDELVVTDHGYRACRNAVEFVAARAGARVVVASLPPPGAADDAIIDAIEARISARTRLALIDHVTSPTAVVLPIERLAAVLAARGVDVLIDGAHGPGLVPVDFAALARAGVRYYAANLHKWVCAPKGVGILLVRDDARAAVRPAVISHGASLPTGERSRFHLEFDWTGTADPTAALVAPVAIDTLVALAGSWAQLLARNAALAAAGAGMLASALGCAWAPPSAPSAMLAVPLPDDPRREPAAADAPVSPLQAQLLADHHIQTVIPHFPCWPQRLLRISAHAYNTRADFERLAAVLPVALAAERA